jgi:hypothetical protein
VLAYPIPDPAGILALLISGIVGAGEADLVKLISAADVRRGAFAE